MRRRLGSFLATAILTAAPFVLPATLHPQEPADSARQDSMARDEEAPLPLEAARSIPIDHVRGTWMSVDVSPDGRQLVFDHLGDLYLLPIEGGPARPLTTGMAFDAQPRFSPDGERVVFTSDRDGGQNIWIMRVDGTDTTQVSKGKTNRAESPEWTPDGGYVVASIGAFRGSPLPKLHLYHVDGGGGMQLIEEPENAKTLGAAFGADDRWIWFARRSGDWQYNAQLPQYQLAVYDREDGEVYSRTSRYGSAFRPTLSPDGRWLVYGTRHDQETGLVLRDLDSGEERWLAYPVQHDDQESRATLDVLPGMSFTPDSRHLVASYDGRLWRLPVEGGAAEEIPFRIGNDLEVGPEVFFDYPVSDDPTFTVRQIRDAVPSPDGTRLAFTALDRLYVSAADGSDPRRIGPAEGSVHFPAWSPDGRWIAYATWEGEQGHLWRIRSDGRGDPERLTGQPGLYTSPAWSPDGERIVLMRGFARDFREDAGPFGVRAAEEIVWIPSSGGEPRLVAPVENRSAPHFRREDSSRIYFYKGGDTDALVSLRWDGTDEREIVRVTGPTPAGADEPMDPTVILIAPVGERALAQVNGQLYVVTVPRVGRTPRISVSDPDDAAFPARRLTDPMGGEFPAWSADGGAVHWSLGNAHFVYDLDAAEAFEDSLEAAGVTEPADTAGPVGEPADDAAGSEDDETPQYEPREIRIEIAAGRDIPSGVAALTGARIVTMNGDEVIEDGVVVVRDNRIEAVGPRSAVTIPADARRIDVAGHTIVPGFVDTHAHMWPAWSVHRTDQWIYAANLAYGVTTTRDPQTSRTDVLTYADRVRAGEIPGPRVYSTGPGVFWQEGISSYEEAEDVLRRYSDYFDTKTIKMYVAGNRQQRQWIIMAARKLGLMPTTEGSLNIRQNLSETIDGYPGLEHSLPIYPVYEDVVRLFAETRRVYTPTLLVSYGGPWAENWFFQTEEVHDDPKLRRFYPHEELDAMTLRRGQWFREEEHVFQDHACFVKDLVEAGGLAGVGSHGQLQGLGYHWELWAMQACDLDEHDALRVATIFGAEAIGLDGDLGSIEPGKLADLVVLRANPLEDIRNTNTVRYVIKNGRLYDGDSLAELHPLERPGPSYWWVTREPAGVPGIGSAGG